MSFTSTLRPCYFFWLVVTSCAQHAVFNILGQMVLQVLLDNSKAENMSVAPVGLLIQYLLSQLLYIFCLCSFCTLTKHAVLFLHILQY